MWNFNPVVGPTSVGVYRACLITVSFLPLRYKQSLHTRRPLHYVAHVNTFSILAYLMMWSGRSRLQKYGFPSGAGLLAVGIEVGQHLVIGAPMEWIDT